MKSRPRFLNLVLVFVFLFSALGFMPKPVQAAPSALRISQVYGGGGNSGAPYTHDFIEIFNAGDVPISLDGLSLQYASATGTGSFGGTATQLTELPEFSLQPGQYFLVQEAAGAGNGVPLPAPDHIDPSPIAMAAGSGKVALVTGDTSLGCNGGSTPCDADQLARIIDLVGYGTANFYEGSAAAPTLSNTTAAFRADGGCTDTDDNAADFTVGAPAPRNSASPINICGVTQTPLKINEFVADHVGTDIYEYIEVFGEPFTDYSDHTLLQIEGDGAGAGLIDSAFSVGTTDGNGIWWTGYLNNVIENGTVSLLLVKGFTGSVGDDIDTTNDGVIDNPLWAETVDSVAVHDGGTDDRAYGSPVLFANYDGLSTFKPGGASRIPDGYDTDSATDWVRNDFDLAGIPGFTGTISIGEAYNTPGEPNMAYTPPPETCGDPYTPIYEIQGSGMSTPLAGEVVSTQGVVVGDFQEGGMNGFNIQDPVGDGDPATSDGIFIYAPGGMNVNVGDYVRVRGTAGEYWELTQISSSQIWLCETGWPLPEPTELVLPVEDAYGFERLEGMLVTIPQDLVIAEYYNFDRFGEIVLSTQRFMTYTALYEPDYWGYQASLEEYFLNSITLDDGRTTQNPDPAIHPNGMEFNLENLFRGGDLVTNVTGILDYAFGLYRIQPTQGADYTPINPRTDSPNIIEGDIKVASFNVLNYFTTFTSEGNVCGPSGNMGCRGADNAEEFKRQRDKILSAISIMDADVVGLIEIENDRPGLDPDYSVADLVAGLNDLMGAGTYDYIPTGAIGTDAIKLALIYKPDKVTPVGNYAILDSSIDGRFLDDYNRPVLAAAFMDNWSEEVFTVAVNHLKSKGSDCNAVEDFDLEDGAGNCNLTRLNAAIAMVDWLATDPIGTGVNNTLIIGDLNSYDKEDPIRAIKAGPDGIPGTGDDYFDLIYDYLGEYAYSYVFDGKIGYLDYAMANVNFAQYVNDVTIWHINADEPDLIDYDMTFKKPAQQAIYAPDAYRSSDHDPVIVTLTPYVNILIDILPGSCQNPFNVKRPGVLPVVILGTAGFDVTEIDPSSITLAGVAPRLWGYEDISTAYDCSNLVGDGYLDLVLHFDSQEIAFVMGEVLDGDLVTLKLIARLLPDFGATRIVGQDEVLVISKGK
jgi:uncharacterized protein